jgi:3alpha(or 20beta)-hydroxysteroid dehydrogenase
MNRLAGRVVFISGGAGGIGAATASHCADEGARVVVADIRDEEGARLAGKLDALYVHLDVRDENAWEQAIRAARERFGRIDALVNNAGVVAHRMLERTTRAEFMDLVEVNQLGVFLGMRAVLPALRRAGGGSIVNIASIAGLSGMPVMLAYCATKFAVVGMTRSAAMELGPSGIRVNAICPGQIDTPMNAGVAENVTATRALPLRRTGTAAEIAAMAVFLCSDESAYCTGSEFVVDGGRLAGTPVL